MLHVTIDGTIPKSSMSNLQDRANYLRRVVSADVGEPIVLELNVVPIELIRIKSVLGAAEKASRD
jgi:hypothetical protein